MAAIEERKAAIEERKAAEIQRHNQQLEVIEIRKLEQDERLEARKSATAIVEAGQLETTFKLELHARYKAFRTENSDLDLEDIATMMPQFIICFRRNEMSDKQKERFATMYNDWTEAYAQGLTSKVKF